MGGGDQYGDGEASGEKLVREIKDGYNMPLRRDGKDEDMRAVAVAVAVAVAGGGHGLKMVCE